MLGINTALQLQVGRDTLDGVRMAVEEINAKGGVLGRKLEVVTADEGESPKEGVAAVNKLTGDNNVNVLIGGYDSGVTLAELPHISRAQTIFLGTGFGITLNPAEGQGRLRQLQIPVLASIRSIPRNRRRA